jgi:hypothetical protein
VADQGLVRETAVAIVGKLKSGEVTPLDLLDVLEKRIAEVDGKVNALPTTSDSGFGGSPAVSIGELRRDIASSSFSFSLR